MNRKIEQRKHEIRVGFTILIGIIIIVFVILAVGNQHGILGDRYHLKVEMSRVNGLQTGAPVRLNGVHVGSVTGVNFSKDISNQKVQIDLEIFHNVQERIRSDSKAHIGTLGLLGDKYVALTMGSPDHRILKNGEQLVGSDPIDVESLIDEGVDIMSLLKTSVNNINQITEKIQNGDGSLGLLLNNTDLYHTLDTLLTDMVSLTQDLTGDETTLTQMLNDSTLYPSLKSMIVNANILTDSLVYGTGFAAHLISDTTLYRDLIYTTHSLNTILGQIENNQGSVGQMINERELYDNLNKTTIELDSLLKDIRKNPKRYIHVEVF